MARGLRKDLTSYGDRDFSLFLRKAFNMQADEGCDFDFMVERTGTTK